MTEAPRTVGPPPATGTLGVGWALGDASTIGFGVGVRVGVFVGVGVAVGRGPPTGGGVGIDVGPGVGVGVELGVGVVVGVGVAVGPGVAVGVGVALGPATLNVSVQAGSTALGGGSDTASRCFNLSVVRKIPTPSARVSKETSIRCQYFLMKRIGLLPHTILVYLCFYGECASR